MIAHVLSVAMRGASGAYRGIRIRAHADTRVQRTMSARAHVAYNGCTRSMLALAAYATHPVRVVVPLAV
jgi:hypothetical protein